MSATAVTKSKQGRSLLATERTIRDLKCSNHHIFGVGDDGLFIFSDDDGESWAVRRFPTKASIWSITTNSRGLVITHGEKVLYISTNSGKSWTPYYPFQFSNAPSIRSLCLYKNQLFIGTKIHPIYGGVWCFDLHDKSTILIKKVPKQMISSMITINNQLVVATGSCRSDVGRIEVCNMSQSIMEASWEQCFGYVNQSFLDLNESEGIIYATTTQNLMDLVPFLKFV